MDMPRHDVLEGWWAQSAFSYCNTLNQRVTGFRAEERRLERLVLGAVAAAEVAKTAASAAAARSTEELGAAREEVQRREEDVARVRAALAHARDWIAYLVDVRARLLHGLQQGVPGTPPGTPPRTPP